MNLANPGGKNLLLTYYFTSAPSTYGQDMRILAIGPAQSRAFTYQLDKSDMENSYAYTIPYRAQVQGTQSDQSISFSMGREPGNPLCQPALLLLLLIPICTSIPKKLQKKRSQSLSILGAR